MTTIDNNIDSRCKTMDQKIILLIDQTSFCIESKSRVKVEVKIDPTYAKYARHNDV